MIILIVMVLVLQEYHYFYQVFKLISKSLWDDYGSLLREYKKACQSRREAYHREQELRLDWRKEVPLLKVNDNCDVLRQVESILRHPDIYWKTDEEWIRALIRTCSRVVSSRRKLLAQRFDQNDVSSLNQWSDHEEFLSKWLEKRRQQVEINMIDVNLNEEEDNSREKSKEEKTPTGNPIAIC